MAPMMSLRYGVLLQLVLMQDTVGEYLIIHFIIQPLLDLACLRPGTGNSL
jgi:hypothetical protein